MKTYGIRKTVSGPAIEKLRAVFKANCQRLDFIEELYRKGKQAQAEFNEAQSRFNANPSPETQEAWLKAKGTLDASGDFIAMHTTACSTATREANEAIRVPLAGALEALADHLSEELAQKLKELDEENQTYGVSMGAVAGEIRDRIGQTVTTCRTQAQELRESNRHNAHHWAKEFLAGVDAGIVRGQTLRIPSKPVPVNVGPLPAHV